MKVLQSIVTAGGVILPFAANSGWFAYSQRGAGAGITKATSQKEYPSALYLSCFRHTDSSPSGPSSWEATGLCSNLSQRRTGCWLSQFRICTHSAAAYSTNS
eukprot:jgi/Botrbrau1/5421/Bobra.182_1s0024.1